MDESKVILIIDELNTYIENDQSGKEIGVAYHNQYGITPVIYATVSPMLAVLFGKYNGQWRFTIKNPGGYRFNGNEQEITDTGAIEKLENIIAISEQRRAQEILDYLAS